MGPSLSSPPGSRKGKWDEDDFEEDLGEEEEEEDEEEEEEDYEEEEDMGEEGLSSANCGPFCFMGSNQHPKLHPETYGP